MESTETVSYNQDPVSFQFSIEEHEVLCEALSCMMECYNVIPYHELMRLPDDSDTRIKYELLDSIRNRVYYVWSQRFQDNE